MLDPEEINEQLELLMEFRRRLEHRRHQLEQYGGEKHAPPEVVNDLRAAREDIRQIKHILSEAGVSPENQPDDDAPVLVGEAIAHLDHAQRSMLNPHLYRFLKWKYRDEEVLERCGEIYPVAVFHAPEQRTSLDSVLLDLEERYPDDEELNPRDARYRTLLRLRAGSRLFDGDTFAMKELVVRSGHIGLRCQLGSYFKCLDTCDSLEWEILSQAHQLQQSDDQSFAAFDQRLPLRSQLHGKVTNPVRDGAFRSAAIAISTLIAYKDRKQTYLWVKKRSQAGVAVHRELFHVLPSFMFQPTADNTQQEYSVTHNVFREYLEEIFNRCEPEDAQRDSNYLYGDPCLKYLQKLILAGRAGLYLSGIAVNLLNLRPEICTVLVIQADEWYRRHSTGRVRGQQRANEAFCFNLEWEDRRDEGKRGMPMIARIPYQLTDEALMQASGNRLRPMHMVPPGAAAFWLGVDVLRDVL